MAEEVRSSGAAPDRRRWGVGSSRQGLGGPVRPHRLPYRATSAAGRWARPRAGPPPRSPHPAGRTHPGRPRGPTSEDPMNAPAPPPDQRPAETTAATGDQWVIGHGHQRADRHRGRGHTAGVHRRRPGGHRRLRPRSVEPRRPWPGPRPVAQPAGRRRLHVRRGDRPGPDQRDRARQRHPRAGAVAAVAHDGPGAEPGRPAVRAPAVARPIRSPSGSRSSTGSGATADGRRPTPRTSATRTSPSASGSTPTSRSGTPRSTRPASGCRPGGAW